MHKNNIERRMQNEKVEDWSYWSQRRDSLKRYPKHESLNPTWYTDNIYSNQSLDLDDTGNIMASLAGRGGGGGGVSHAHAHRNIHHPHQHHHRDMAAVAAAAATTATAAAPHYRLDHTPDHSDQFDDDEIFSINPRTKHATGNLLLHGGANAMSTATSAAHRGDYKYPKSRSCCFGGGYDPQPSAAGPLIPKSRSFGATGRTHTATLVKQHSAPAPYNQRPSGGARFECCARIGAHAARREDDVVLERLTYRRSVAGSAPDDFERRQLESDLCYARQRDDASRHSMYMLDETYPPRRRPKIDIERMRNKTDYIRNEWLNKSKQRMDANGGKGDGWHDAHDDLGHFGGYPHEPSSQVYGHQHSHHQHMHHQQSQQPIHVLSPVHRRLPQPQQQQLRPRRQQRQSSAYDSDADQFGAGARLFGDDIDAELEQDFEAEAAGVEQDYFAYMRRPQRPAHPVAKSKSALEVQAPSRYDDTSSDSTDVDLDDFNFDFEKYWENLDKTNSSYDIDIQNNNTYNNLGRGRKVKDVNVSRYNNGRMRAAAQARAAAILDEDEPYQPENGALFLGKHSHLLESLLAPSLDSSDNQEYQEHLQGYNDPRRRLQIEGTEVNGNSNGNNNNNMTDGAGYLSDTEFMAAAPAVATASSQPAGQRSSSSPFHRPFGHKVYPDASLYHHSPRRPTYPPPPPPPPILKHPQQQPMFVPVHLGATSPAHQATSGRRRPNTSGTHNPFSLINNIFSIYKPKKYSPLNCNAAVTAATAAAAAGCSRTVPPPSRMMSQRAVTVAKKMNVASTIRPLGGPANDFITSLKRPLLVTPSPCVEQPHFKIIPEKTGLKISPLYRFDYDSGERKYMLRSTARPLMMFPN